MVQNKIKLYADEDDDKDDDEDSDFGTEEAEEKAQASVWDISTKNRQIRIFTT